MTFILWFKLNILSLLYVTVLAFLQFLLISLVNNYTINDKYLMTFTMRADGSSKFASGNQWGYFPSLALAWRISFTSLQNHAACIVEIDMFVSRTCQ